jgi:hypothetical protein
MAGSADGRLQSVTYYNLPDAAWDRVSGLHSVDFGIDVVVDGQVWSMSWAGDRGDWFLNVQPESLAGRLRSEIETVHASALAPWAEVIGEPVRIEQIHGCLARILAAGLSPIVVASGAFVDPLDTALLFGPNVLVAADPRWAATLLNADASQCDQASAGLSIH